LDGLGQPNEHLLIEAAGVAAEAGILPPAAPGQGNQRAGPIGGIGLDRFLQLALRDEEDEWDSDELDEDDLEFRGMEAEPRQVHVGLGRNRRR
jgi:hypothetical protein